MIIILSYNLRSLQILVWEELIESKICVRSVETRSTLGKHTYTCR